MTKTIWTTQRDKERLFHCLESLGGEAGNRERPHIQELEEGLAKAQLVEGPESTPPDLITMRSKVTLVNLNTGRELNCTLVYPEEGNPEKDLISVLAPLGTAMLGHRVGDDFTVQLPRGSTTFRVAALPYQPESAGDQHL